MSERHTGHCDRNEDGEGPSTKAEDNWCQRSMHRAGLTPKRPRLCTRRAIHNSISAVTSTRPTMIETSLASAGRVFSGVKSIFLVEQVVDPAAVGKVLIN